VKAASLQLSALSFQPIVPKLTAVEKRRAGKADYFRPGDCLFFEKHRIRRESIQGDPVPV
jgi:hypothetical protein